MVTTVTILKWWLQFNHNIYDWSIIIYAWTSNWVKVFQIQFLSTPTSDQYLCILYDFVYCWRLCTSILYSTQDSNKIVRFRQLRIFPCEHKLFWCWKETTVTILKWWLQFNHNIYDWSIIIYAWTSSIHRAILL
jgi:hypothetical protein